jgi:hypothetical protein
MSSPYNPNLAESIIFPDNVEVFPVHAYPYTVVHKDDPSVANAITLKLLLEFVTKFPLAAIALGNVSPVAEYPIRASPAVEGA